MKTLRLFTLILSVFAICQAGLGADAKADPNINQAKVALRARQYAEAVVALDKALGAKIKQADEALYLKGLALFYDKKYNACLKVCDTLGEEHADSKWTHKGQFLKAAALVEKREFKQAEQIYEAAANRLLAEARKKDVAGVIIRFADALTTKPKPDDLKSPPPNFNKAHKLYQQALAMEIGRALRDEVMFKGARAVQQAGNHGQAINEFRAYLAEFDPDWTGNVGSVSRASGQKKEKPKAAGNNPLLARYHLAEAQLKAQQYNPSRVNFEDLLALIEKKKAQDKQAQLIADSRWQIIRTYRMPSPGGNDLDRAVKAAQGFLKEHPKDSRAVVAAYWIAQAYQNISRPDQAIAAYGDFMQKKLHQIPEGDAATAKLDEFRKSPAELQNDWEKLALYRIGQLRYGQKKYDAAIESWQSYINKHPDGPNWANCQRGVINANFKTAIDAVSEKNYAKGKELFEAFLAKHPLDDRARQILFIFGQIEFEKARKLEEKRDDSKTPANARPKEEEIAQAYQGAIDRWNRLVSKYPNTEESSVALYRIGLIREEKLGDWKSALESYRRLAWGSKAGNSRMRVQLMTEKRLRLETERKFRTNEKALIKLDTRNIKKVKQYFLDLEVYFRKTHQIGRIDDLDIALIEPDKTWEVEIKDYTDYKPIEQDVEIPFEKNKAGVCIVNVSSEDYEASTLLIRSDLDLIMKSSRREALVFVENMATGKSANDVKLLFSDGKKIIGTGTIKKDGVLTQQFEELKSLNDIRVLAIKDGHMASNLLNLSGLRFSKGLAAKGYLYTDRPAYQPGHTVRLRGIIRDVKDGSYTAPAGEVYEVSVSDSQGRLLWEKEKKLSEYGTFFAEMQLDDRASLGSYTLRARAKDKENVIYASTFQVAKYQLEKIKLKLESNQPVYFRGEEVALTIKAQYYWGQPLADKELHYYLPDGRHLSGKTNDKGELVVKFDTSGIRTGTLMAFRVAIEGENVSASHLAMLAHQGYSIKVSTSQPLVLSGAPFDVSIETKTPDGKPAGREVTLFVLRRQTPKAEPVLNAVPWLRGLAQRSSSEVTVEEKKVITDKQTGKATVNLELEKGGRYILRVSGEDRFEQVVTGEQVVTISDDEDATKLRFFAETDTLQVGGQAKLRLHSRLDNQLALLTFEGEEILSYQVITLKQGFNPIAQEISHRHFPNFRVSVAVMDERTLRTAAKPFSVERQLKVTLKPEKKIYEPGAQAKVEISVTDQLGKPVQGEFSLALLSVYPESTPKILSFFQQDAYRHAEFRLQSTCAFGYRGKTTKVFKNEQERLVREQQEGRKIAQLEEFSKRLMAENELENNDDVANKPAEMAQKLGQAFGAGTPGFSSNAFRNSYTIDPVLRLPIGGRDGGLRYELQAKGQLDLSRTVTGNIKSQIVTIDSTTKAGESLPFNIIGSMGGAVFFRIQVAKTVSGPGRRWLERGIGCRQS